MATFLDRLRGNVDGKSSNQKTKKKPRLSKDEREKKKKEKEIRSLILEVSFYIIFLVLLLTTATNNIDNQAFGYRLGTLTSINNGNILKMRTTDELWKWLQHSLLPFLYPTHKWNASKLPNSTSLVSTHASYRIGPLRIRQHRVKDDACPIDYHFEAEGIRCVLGWSNSHMDYKHYNGSWDREQFIPKPQDDTVWSPWEYRRWQQVGGLPVMGVYGVYPVGGYVIDFNGSGYDAMKGLSDLQNSGWLDEMTRFVSVEMTLFSPGANLFAMVEVIFEFPQAGLIQGVAHVYPFRLFSYVGGYPMAKMACDAFVYMAIVWFVGREVSKVMQERLNYFTQFWNLLELANLLLSITAVTLYIGRHIVTTYVSQDIAKKRGQFYNFQTLAVWNELFGILLGFVCFLSTLQLLHLLRFNHRMSLLAATLKVAAKDLAAFSLVFIIVFAAFVSFCCMVFGPSLITYSSVIKSVETLVTVALGTIDYYRITYVNWVLAPIFLFAYMMFIVFILINFLITILNDSFAVVREDITKQPNDYELVDYIIERLATFVWSLNPVKSLWGTAKDAGLVKTEAPKITQKSTVNMRHPANYTARRRHRMTFNSDLLRLHHRLDALEMYFTLELVKDNGIRKDIDFSSKRHVTFSQINESIKSPTAYSNNLDLSGGSDQNDAKEQVVPGILKFKQSKQTDDDDCIVPISNDIGLNSPNIGDKKTRNDSSFFSKSLPGDKIESVNYGDEDDKYVTADDSSLTDEGSDDLTRYLDDYIRKALSRQTADTINETNNNNNLVTGSLEEMELSLDGFEVPKVHVVIENERDESNV